MRGLHVRRFQLGHAMSGPGVRGRLIHRVIRWGLTAGCVVGGELEGGSRRESSDGTTTLNTSSYRTRPHGKEAKGQEGRCNCVEGKDSFQ